MAKKRKNSHLQKHEEYGKNPESKPEPKTGFSKIMPRILSSKKIILGLILTVLAGGVLTKLKSTSQKPTTESRENAISPFRVTATCENLGREGQNSAENQEVGRQILENIRPCFQEGSLLFDERAKLAAALDQVPNMNHIIERHFAMYSKPHTEPPDMCEILNPFMIDIGNERGAYLAIEFDREGRKIFRLHSLEGQLRLYRTNVSLGGEALFSTGTWVTCQTEVQQNTEGRIIDGVNALAIGKDDDYQNLENDYKIFLDQISEISSIPLLAFPEIEDLKQISIAHESIHLWLTKTRSWRQLNGANPHHTNIFTINPENIYQLGTNPRRVDINEALAISLTCASQEFPDEAVFFNTIGMLNPATPNTNYAIYQFLFWIAAANLGLGEEKVPTTYVEYLEKISNIFETDGMEGIRRINALVAITLWKNLPPPAPFDLHELNSSPRQN